ncbi:MAG: hypothetical protein CR975_03140 [Gammaproteobacteria bacterium]|nr:MAG: hypothetical protein CR975_03140 [Gammaproteobacteria bacterium]
MQGLISAWRNTAPLIYLLSGVFFTLLACLYLSIYPTLLSLVVAVVTALAAFYYQRFFLLGIALATMAVYINAPRPYQQTFTDCRYQADITRANYSRKKRGKVVYLEAKNIHCDGQRLADQRLQFWDNRGQLAGLENQRLTLNSQLQPVYAHLNPYVFDYEKVLIAGAIRLTIKKPQIIAKQPQRRPILLLKNHFAAAIRENLSADNAAIILALVTGNRSAMSPRQKETLQQTGTSHILAISGLHLGLIGGLAWLLGQWAWAASWRLSEKAMPIQAGAVFALLIISVYALLTGFDIPVKRAWTMFSLLILSWLWLKSLHNALLFAAVAVMLVEPYAVVSVGFYYSFIATFIVLWSARLPYPPLLKVLLMQALINLTLLPITWLAFGDIPVSAFFVNLLIIPWLGFWVLPWAILACITALITPGLAAPLWSLVDFTAAAMWQTLRWFAELNMMLSPDTLPALISVVVAVGSVLLTLMTGKKYWLLGFFVLIVPLKMPHRPTLVLADGRSTSLLIDNGSAAIIINPGRKYRHINQAKKWHHYLQQQHLTLAAIILENDKISRISATAWLLKKYPAAVVITLKDFPAPYPSHYCQNVSGENLQLITHQQGRHCQAELHWFGQVIEIFNQNNQTDNAILSKSRLLWQGQTYSAQALGAVQIRQQVKQGKPRFSLSYLRQSKRLWRIPR